MILGREFINGGKFNGQEILGMKLNGFTLYPYDSQSSDEANNGIGYNIFIVNVESIYESIELEHSFSYWWLNSNKGRGLYIDWGDGNIEEGTTYMDSKTFSHTYDKVGQYVITTTLGPKWDHPTSPSNIVEIIRTRNDLNRSEYGSIFSCLHLLKKANITIPSTLTSLEYLLQDNVSLTNFTTTNWNTTQVTTMKCMFEGCSSLVNVNLRNINVENVTTMLRMFLGCSSLETLDISNWYAPNLTDTSNMFGVTQTTYGCPNLHTIRMDNCNSYTISKIIKGIPNFKNDGTIRRIYCKQTNATGLTAPGGWQFEYID